MERERVREPEDELRGHWSISPVYVIELCFDYWGALMEEKLSLVHSKHFPLNTPTVAPLFLYNMRSILKSDRSISEIWKTFCFGLLY